MINETGSIPSIISIKCEGARRYSPFNPSKWALRTAVISVEDGVRSVSCPALRRGLCIPIRRRLTDNVKLKYNPFRCCHLNPESTEV